MYLQLERSASPSAGDVELERSRPACACKCWYAVQEEHYGVITITITGTCLTWGLLAGLQGRAMTGVGGGEAQALAACCSCLLLPAPLCESIVPGKS